MVEQLRVHSWPSSGAGGVRAGAGRAVGGWASCSWACSAGSWQRRGPRQGALQLTLCVVDGSSTHCSACEGLGGNLAHQLPAGADQLLGACVICVRLFFATPLRHLKTVYCVFVYLCAANVSRCQRNSFTIMMVPLQALASFQASAAYTARSEWRAYSPPQRCCCYSHASPPPPPQALPSCAAPPQRSPLLLRCYGATSLPAACEMMRPGSATTWTALPIPWSVWLRETSSCGATTQVGAALAPHAKKCTMHLLLPCPFGASAIACSRV